MNLTFLLGLALADKATYAPDMETMFRTELGYKVIRSLKGKFSRWYLIYGKILSDHVNLNRTYSHSRVSLHFQKAKK